MQNRRYQSKQKHFNHSILFYNTLIIKNATSKINLEYKVFIIESFLYIRLHVSHASICSMADGISFDISLSLNCTEEVLRNRTLTSRFWKLESGLYAPPP